MSFPGCYRGCGNTLLSLHTSQVNTSLKVLDMRCNSDIGAAGGQPLVDAIMVRATCLMLLSGIG